MLTRAYEPLIVVARQHEVGFGMSVQLFNRLVLLDIYNKLFFVI